jgi:hypothetical protein
MLGKKWFLIGLLSLGLGASTPWAMAKDGGACKADVEKFCKNVEKGGGRIKQCLQDHKGEVSTECRTKMEKHEQRKVACKADAEKFCKDIPRGKGQMKACMKSHENELSPACKALI